MADESGPIELLQGMLEMMILLNEQPKWQRLISAVSRVMGRT